MTQRRLHWVEGKIAYRLGEYDEAESIFSQIWEEFRVHNLNQEVVLVTIDLAQVLAAQDEPERAAQLAAECYSIMKNWGLHKDALAAWVVFQEALSRENVRSVFFGRFGVPPALVHSGSVRGNGLETDSSVPGVWLYHLCHNSFVLRGSECFGFGLLDLPLAWPSCCSSSGSGEDG